MWARSGLAALAVALALVGARPGLAALAAVAPLVLLRPVHRLGAGALLVTRSGPTRRLVGHGALVMLAPPVRRVHPLGGFRAGAGGLAARRCAPLILVNRPFEPAIVGAGARPCLSTLRAFLLELL